MLVLHEVESYRQRVEVHTVAVVDEQTVVDAFAHLEAHCHRRQRAATGGDFLPVVAKVEHQRYAMHSVLDGGTVYERYLDGSYRLAFVADVEDCRMLFDDGFVQLHHVFVRRAPGEAVQTVQALLLGDDGMYVAVVEAVDEHLAMGEELQLFGNFLMPCKEVLVVGLTYVGEDAYGWLYDIAQGLHLAGLGDTGLEDRHIVVARHLPYRQGDADLGVVAFGACGNVMVG